MNCERETFDRAATRDAPRCGFLATEFPPGPGGIGTHAFELASQLHQLGWSILVVTPQDYATADEIAAFNRVQPYAVMRLEKAPGVLFKLLRRWRVARRCFNEFQPHVLLASGQRGVWLGGLLSREHARPWVAVGHGSEFGLSPGWSHRLTRWAFARATSVVTVSRFTEALMLKSGIRPRQQCVIPNGADAARFTVLSEAEINAFRTSIGMKAAELLLTVGHVTERKGQQVVIRTLPQILKERPKVHYLMAGLPTAQEKFQQLAQELGVAERVHFLGRVDDHQLVRYLNACDVFVMTSTMTKDGDCEGYGIAVVEAAFCGKPAVVSANSGLAEAIVDGETGLAVAPANEVATARAIIRLLADDSQRRAMGEAARARALREQTWEHRARTYDTLLRSLLPTRGSATAVRAGRSVNPVAQ